MSLGHEHGLVLIGLADPMDVVNLSLSLFGLSKSHSSMGRYQQFFVQPWPVPGNVVSTPSHALSSGLNRPFWLPVVYKFHQNCLHHGTINYTAMAIAEVNTSGAFTETAF